MLSPSFPRSTCQCVADPLRDVHEPMLSLTFLLNRDQKGDKGVHFGVSQGLDRLA